MRLKNDGRKSLIIATVINGKETYVRIRGPLSDTTNF